MDILLKINKKVSEPKVFVLLVRSARCQVLYSGVHFSLEEAYSVARRKIEALAPHKYGDAVDIDLWDIIPARQLIAQFLDPSKVNELISPSSENTSNINSNNPTNSLEVTNLPPNLYLPPAIEKILKQADLPTQEEIVPIPTLDDHIQDVKESKNDLMKKLINEGDSIQVEKLKNLLGPYSTRYVLREIDKKAKKTDNS